MTYIISLFIINLKLIYMLLNNSLTESFAYERIYKLQVVAYTNILYF